MTYLPRRRKKVQAVQRGPDGSAFKRCEGCGVLVAIALADMHECESNENAKKLKVSSGKENAEMHKFQDQPRSAFRFFVEEFVKTCEEENEVDVDRKAVEIWKNMSASERQPYAIQADKLNSAYAKALLKEENDILWVDDEADSAGVGKFDKDYEDCYTCENSGDSGGLWSDTSGSFHIFKGATMNPWTFEESL